MVVVVKLINFKIVTEADKIESLAKSLIFSFESPNLSKGNKSIKDFLNKFN